MKASTLVAALFGAGVLAAPSTGRRHNRRTTRAGRSGPPRNVTSAASIDSTKDDNAQYSTNWAGAVLVGNGYTTVSGAITVPVPQEPPGADPGTQYAATAWVGIDGYTCGSAIIQTGVDFYIENGQTSYDAWYEWYPDYSYNFDGIDVNPGDNIEMSVVATSANSGTAYINNLSTGQSVSHDFSGQSGNLCQTNAEWIVEDFSSGYNLVPFADFTTVRFTGATAESDEGTVDASGATIMDIRQNGQVLTSCSASGGDVTCSYE